MAIRFFFSPNHAVLRTKWHRFSNFGSFWLLLELIQIFCISFSRLPPFEQSCSGSYLQQQAKSVPTQASIHRASIHQRSGGGGSHPFQPIQKYWKKKKISKASTTPKASHFSGCRMEWPVPKWPYQKPPGPWVTPYSDQTGTIPIEKGGGCGTNDESKKDTNW